MNCLIVNEQNREKLITWGNLGFRMPLRVIAQYEFCVNVSLFQSVNNYCLKVFGELMFFLYQCEEFVN